MIFYNSIIFIIKEIKVGDKFDFVLPYSTWTNKETGTSYEEGIIPKNTAPFVPISPKTCPS